MVLSVKARLQQNADSPGETRRFVMSSDLIASYKELCAKVERIFSSLPGNSYKIYWKDEEDDEIVISSDEELSIAVSQAQNELLKIVITIVPKTSSQVTVPKVPVVGVPSNGPEKKVEKQKQEQLSEQAPPHYSECSQQNRSADRTQVADGTSTLGACRRKNQRSHCRGTEPEAEKGEKSQQNQTRDSSSTRNKKQTVHIGVICDGCSTDVQGYRYKCMECDNYDLCDECHAKDIHPNHNMWKFASPPDYMNLTMITLTDALRRMFGRVSSGFYPSVASKSSRRRRGCYPTGSASGSPAQGNSSPSKEDAKPTQQSPSKEDQEEFLRNIGETVAAVLNPLGINVDIDVEHKNGQREQVHPSTKTEEKTLHNLPPGYHYWSNAAQQWYNANATTHTPETNAYKPHTSETSVTPPNRNSYYEPLPPMKEKDPAVPLAATVTSPASRIPSKENSKANKATEVSSPEAPLTHSTSVQVDQSQAPEGAVGKGSGNVSIEVQTDSPTPCRTLPKRLADMATETSFEIVPPISVKDQPSASLQQENVTSEDWYVVNELRKWGFEGLSPAAGDGSESSKPKEAEEAAHDNLTPPVIPVIPEQSTPLNPYAISEVVQQMKAMGFKDDNGWLTRMVQENNGDVGAVLDKILGSIPPSTVE